MARPLRVLFRGALYHVTARGNERKRVYRDGNDYSSFYEYVGSTVERYCVVCHGFSLLGNHYHLIFETPRGNLPEAMRHLNGCYTQWFNRRHRRCGHLFQGRYKAVLVEKEAHLLSLVRYLARNPLQAGLCERPEDWPWASYPALLGLTPPPAFLTTNWVLAQFARDRATARKLLKSFVDATTDNEALPLRGDIYLAGDDFLRRHVGKREPIEEIPRAHWQPICPELNELFATHPDPIKTAYHDYGYTLRQIAEHLNCHYSTISRRLQRAEQDAHEQN
jgi:REP element-mobilizing transposase RayT